MARLVWIGTAWAIAAGVAGCGDRAASPSGEVEPKPSQEQLAEVEVGMFHIPLPAKTVPHDEPVDETARHDLLLRFRLWVVVPTIGEHFVAKRIETHGGRMCEDVVEVCRAASLDELSEPTLATVKGQLTNVLTRYFGGRHLRSVVLTHVLLEST